MSTIARRIIVTLTLTAAPFLILLGVASAHAESGLENRGPSVVHHEPFPHQRNQPTPGTAEHHHHQFNHANKS